MKSEYMTSTTSPILYHVHGIGDHDFSSLRPEELSVIDDIAQERGTDLVPTIFLRPEYVPGLEDVTREWSERRATGGLERIVGFGIEGPLLGTAGGVPPAGCWMPDRETWGRIAALGNAGLRYIVIAPDSLGLDEKIEDGYTFRNLVDELLHNGVRLALGHFRHDDPQRSADMTEELIDYVAKRAGGGRFGLVTDHLYNDMPRAFKHAWRTDAERRCRDEQLAPLSLHDWDEALLPILLGPVPAVILAATKADKLTPMLNFDGDHVDLAICAATVRYLGAHRIIAITDHTETFHMAGSALEKDNESTLLLRDGHVVAAGSTGIDAQIVNMISFGLTPDEIDLLVDKNPRQALTPLATVGHDLPVSASSAEVTK